MAKKDVPDPKTVIEAVNNEARVEFIKGFDPDKLSDEQKMHLFKQAVLEKSKDLCSNCGSDHKVRALMIVPLEAGGKFSLANGTTQCRACEMAASVISRSPTGQAQRPVNFWVSHRMYNKVKQLNGFNSTGSLVRFLMKKFVTHDDLLQYGLIPEFVGRLPMAVSLEALGKEDLRSILTEPKNALLKQFQRFFAMDGVELIFEDAALDACAEKSIRHKTGARGLRTVLEDTLLDVMYDIPSRGDIKQCVVTVDSIENGERPLLLNGSGKPVPEEPPAEVAEIEEDDVEEAS
ncbi:MAG: hypothetical protein IIB88_06740 [Chloroflexi bacterium]|nr:hypothetical protein [Chloroflexota bacterium]